jgi:hypothetical protein
MTVAHLVHDVDERETGSALLPTSGHGAGDSGAHAAVHSSAIIG